MLVGCLSFWFFFFFNGSKQPEDKKIVVLGAVVGRSGVNLLVRLFFLNVPLEREQQKIKTQFVILVVLMLGIMCLYDILLLWAALLNK